jgi:hypothetical protein
MGRVIVSVVVSLLHSLQFLIRLRGAPHLEILALRHQLVVTSRSRRPRLRLTVLDRMLWGVAVAPMAWLALSTCDYQKRCTPCDD